MAVRPPTSAAAGTVAEQLLGLVPPAELVEGGGADAAHERRAPGRRPARSCRAEGQHEVDQVVTPAGLDQRAPQVDVGARPPRPGRRARRRSGPPRAGGRWRRRCGPRWPAPGRGRGGPGPRRRGRPPPGPARSASSARGGPRRPARPARARGRGPGRPGPAPRWAAAPGRASTASSYAARASAARPGAVQVPAPTLVQQAGSHGVVGHRRCRQGLVDQGQRPDEQPAPAGGVGRGRQQLAAVAPGGRLGIGGPVPQAHAPLERAVRLGHRERGLGRPSGPHRGAEGGVEVAGRRPVAGQAGPPLIGPGPRRPLLALGERRRRRPGAGRCSSPGSTSASTASCTRAWRNR